MVFDITIEKPIPLQKARSFFPPGRRDRAMAFTTILRFVLDGVRIPGGERVKLDAVRIGSRWCTSKEAILRFVKACTPDLEAPRQEHGRPIGHRAIVAERAEKKLSEMGV